MQQLSDTNPTTAPDLGLTMTQVLRNPLAALRVAMESAACEFRADDPRAPTLRAALENVLALSRDVEALIDWTKPRLAVPARCSCQEVLHGAVRRLVFEHAARVRVVDDTGEHTLFTDAALLTDSLHLPLRALLMSGASDVLLRANIESDGTTTFALVQQAPDKCAETSGERTTSERERLIGLLGSELARREVERLGGTFSIERTEFGNIHVRVRLPAGDQSSAA